MTEPVSAKQHKTDLCPLGHKAGLYPERHNSQVYPPGYREVMTLPDVPLVTEVVKPWDDELWDLLLKDPKSAAEEAELDAILAKRERDYHE